VIIALSADTVLLEGSHPCTTVIEETRVGSQQRRAERGPLRSCSWDDSQKWTDFHGRFRGA